MNRDPIVRAVSEAIYHAAGYQDLFDTTRWAERYAKAAIAAAAPLIAEQIAANIVEQVHPHWAAHWNDGLVHAARVAREYPSGQESAL